MAKIVRLTESDLVRIVKRVISEQPVNTSSLKGKQITKKRLTIQSTKPYQNRVGQYEIHADAGDPNAFMIFGCKAHERGDYLLYPNNDGSNTLTQVESQMLYDALCTDSNMG